MDTEQIIMPPPLARGDCIGLFLPSGPVRNQEKFNAGIHLLHELGFRTKQYPAFSAAKDYLAADDECRAEEFHSMWIDPEVHALMAVRGGFGCLRLMSHLDTEILRENPKLVIGFSDLTVLLNTLVDRVGIAALHGPVLTSLAGSDTASLDSFAAQVTGNFEGNIALNGLEILRGGTATGTIRGGNLTTLAHLLGTPWEIPCKGTLLLLEDTGEPMYKIDRILTQLYVSGRLDHLSGIMLGTFDYSAGKDSSLQLQKQVWERVLELTAHTDCPVWGNFPVGHLSVNHTIPLGITAVMDSSTETLCQADAYRCI